MWLTAQRNRWGQRVDTCMLVLRQQWQQLPTADLDG
jgi:hypothetical protein